MGDPAWLHELCCDESARPSTPFRIEAHGRVWLVATDGRRLIAVESDWAPTRPLVPPAVADLIPPVADLIPDLESGTPIDLEALRAWCTPPPPVEPGPCMRCNDGAITCHDCYGEGERECSECGQDAGCDLCDGTGRLPCPGCDPNRDPPPRPGVVLGLSVDLDLLHGLIRHVSGECRAAIVDRMLRLDGEGWRAVLMTCLVDDVDGLPAHLGVTP